MIITVETEIEAPIEKVWERWTDPKHIINWNYATEEWCCPSAKNDLKPGGEFLWRMEAKDGSMGFDFTGTYRHIEKGRSISYIMTDGRKVDIHFLTEGDKVRLSESFEAEGTHTDEQQRTGWQAIIGNFKKYVETER